MGVSIDHSFIFVLYLSLWRCRAGALVVFIRLSPRWLEDQTSASRETSSQVLKPFTVLVPSKTCQPMGASVLASCAVYSALHGHGDDSSGHHPVSFVGSQVPRAYPLRQETGVTGRVEQSEPLLRRHIILLTTLQPGENVQLTNILVPLFHSAFSTIERPMKIEIVVDPVNIPSQSLASRVAPAPTTATTGATDTPRYGKDPLSFGAET